MRVLFILPFLLGAFKLLAPLAIRTIGGALISSAASRITGVGGSVQSGPVVDELAEEEEEFLEDEDEEEEEEEEEELAPRIQPIGAIRFRGRLTAPGPGTAPVVISPGGAIVRRPEFFGPGRTR